jgi:hypothetical protein
MTGSKTPAIGELMARFHRRATLMPDHKPARIIHGPLSARIT